MSDASFNRKQSAEKEIKEVFALVSFGTGAGGPPVGSPALNTAATYASLASSTITNTGSSVLTGDMGLYPGTSITGFPPGTVSGSTHLTDAAAQQAQVDATAAYTDLSTRTPTTIPAALDGQTLTAGVYQSSGGTFSLAASGNGTLTLNGSATDIFVFQTATTLTTGAGGTPTITLTGGVLASNVYWAVGSSATLNVSGTGTMVGTVIASSSITVDGGNVNGRTIALNGAVTISAASNITVPAVQVASPTLVTGYRVQSVTRVSTGLYQVTLTDKFPSLKFVEGTFQTSLPQNLKIQLQGQAVSTAKTINIYTLSGAVPTDPTTNTQLYLRFDLKNTAVKF